MTYFVAAFLVLLLNAIGGQIADLVSGGYPRPRKPETKATAVRCLLMFSALSAWAAYLLFT